jgi:hypothetical protein
MMDHKKSMSRPLTFLSLISLLPPAVLWLFVLMLRSGFSNDLPAGISF